MLIYLLLITLLLAIFAGVSSQRSTIRTIVLLFSILQILFGVVVAMLHTDETSAMFFTFDRLGLLFYFIMSIIAAVAFHASDRYLDREQIREYKFYMISLMLLCASATAVYFANNIAVTWIFLEATTLCTAALVYHRRNMRSLEATWKYIFVCSTGIAMAYLGILLICSVATEGDISYAALSQAILTGDPFYMKAAFLLVFAGYSCKMEIFPLYTIGIDANFAAPTPASSIISTVLVNAGFVAIFRMFKLFEATAIAPWCSNVLIIAGLMSVAIGALYIRRTNNYKRLLAYSTTENMGLAIIGIGLGGVGIVASLLHIVVHSMLKGGIFTLLSQVGKTYGNYRINRLGNYMSLNPIGATALLLGGLGLTAFPPSGLFISELMIFSQIIEQERWWLLAIVVILLCVVIYSILQHIISLCFKSTDVSHIQEVKMGRLTALGGVALIIVAMIIGAFQPDILSDYILQIVQG